MNAPRTLSWVLSLSLTCAAALAFAQARPQPAPAFHVIVNVRNPVSSLSREGAAELFLRKTTRWPDGSIAKPVDQASSSLVRAKFSESVVKRSVAAVRNYWQQMIFTGRDVPPPELDSDAAVISYVIKHESAIGYVSGTADVTHVKIMTVR